MIDIVRTLNVSLSIVLLAFLSAGCQTSAAISPTAPALETIEETTQPTVAESPTPLPTSTTRPTQSPTPAQEVISTSEGELPSSIDVTFTLSGEETSAFVAHLDALSISLSPNGRWIVGDTTDSLVIYDTQAKARVHEIPFPNGLIDEYGLAWSLDGEWAAFTEDVKRTGDDSDIWVLEAQSGSLLNLTDDGYTGFISDSLPQDQIAFVDYFPAWSPDGRELVFARFIPGPDLNLTLQRISLQGGEPVELLKLSDVTLVYKPVWSPDGDSIYYSLVELPDYTGGSIWRMDANGQFQEQLPLAEAPAGLNNPKLIEISATGEYGLILYTSPVDPDVVTNLSLFAVLNLETGEVRPLKTSGNPAGPVEFYTPVKATFSPDGNYVLYMYRDPQKGLPLILSPVAGGEEIILIEDTNVIQRLFFYNPELTLGLDWAKDGTVYLQTYHGSGVVFNYQP